MPRGKPGSSVKAKLAIKPARERTPMPKRRQRAPADGPKTTRRAKPSDAALLAVVVERLQQELADARRQLAVLEARADVDPLTELPNRRAFERELARSLAYVKRHGTGAALLYLDLDDFKRVNDRHGHAAGDAMLRAVASVLGRHVRESDVVARIGGDEFALLLWNCDEADAAAKALALEVSIGRTIATHAGVALTVGASVGTAQLLPLDEPAETIGRADRAMYARKAARRAVPAAE
ncbi:MAG TPA: GGDEF domain-containing protein [Xanthobacteraceae bacterium]|nr:GGDEF domain-containing protein [Xanthobacteraceae bacterium]